MEQEKVALRAKLVGFPPTKNKTIIEKITAEIVPYTGIGVPKKVEEFVLNNKKELGDILEWLSKVQALANTDKKHSKELTEFIDKKLNNIIFAYLCMSLDAEYKLYIFVF